MCPTQYNIPLLATPASGQLDLSCGSCCDTGLLGDLLGSSGSCSTGGCRFGVNPSNGNLWLGISTPNAGAVAPSDQLVYNSKLGGVDGFGSGFQSSILGKRVEGEWDDCDVRVIDCDGSQYPFIGLQEDDTYEYNIGGAPFAFKRTATGWIERRPQPGPKFTYNTDGELISIENMSGQIWTVIYDPPISILDPFGQRTTYTFDAGNSLDITDVFGRKTTFIMDGNGNLQQRITPELCITSFSYGPGPLYQLQAMSEPDGSITTFSYDANNWCTGFQKPTGSRYTFSYLDWYTTKIQDPAGFVTTLVHDGLTRRLAAVVNPLGIRATYSWDQGQTSSTVSPAGLRTTFVYTTTFDNLSQIEAVIGPTGTTTYVYDSGAAIAMIDPLGHRTTYVRDGSNVLSAIVDPLGNRTTYLYDGQTSTTINPLGYRTTLTYGSFVPSGTAGLVIMSKDPLGNITTFSYNKGQLFATLSPLGYITGQNVYDDVNRVVAKVDALLNRTTFTYDLGGRLWTTTNPLGHVTTNVYSQGQLIATIDPLGARTTFTYEPRGNRETVQDPLGNVTTFVFDEANRHHATINPLGYRTTTVYDSFNRVQATISPSGARTTTSYDSFSRPETTIDPLGYRTTSVYDTLGRVKQVIDALGHVSSTVYDALGRVEATVDPLGHASTTVYDPAGQAIASVDPLGFRTTTSYDPAGRLEAVMNPLGFVWTTVSDNGGRAVQHIDPLGNISSTVYDNNNRVEAAVDPLGFRSTTVFDGAGRTRATIDPLGFRTTYTYDANGRQTAVTNARGYKATTVYDLAGRTEATIDPLGNTTTFGYDQAGNVRSFTNALSFVTTSTYGPVGIDTVENALGFVTTLGYDLADRQNQVTTPLGFVTTTVFDEVGRPQATINPLNFRTTTVYDPVGRPMATVDANGNRTTTTYDNAGRATAQMNALGYLTTSVYDDAGQHKALVNALGYRTSFSYDKAGRRREVIDPLGRITTAAYDAASRQTLRHDPRDYVTTYSYDGNRRLTGRLYPDGSRHTFAFDAVGNRQKMEDPTGIYTYTYDALDRPSVVTNGFGNTVTYAYDAIGQRATLEEPEGTIFTYVYDAVGQLQQVWNYAGLATSYTYDANGRRTRQQPISGNFTATYDAADRVDGLRNTFTFKYDPVGNLTWRRWFGRTTTFTYDNNNQVLSELHQNNSSSSESYVLTHVYDPIGNHIRAESFQQGFSQVSTFSFDDAGQLISVVSNGSPLTYTYDAAGNRQSAGTPTYTWDYENQLIVEDRGSTVTTSVYNADFRRVEYARSDFVPFVRRITWDGDAYLSEMDENGVVQHLHTTEPTAYGDVIAVRRLEGSQLPTYFLLYDNNGNMVQWHKVSPGGSTQKVYQAFGRQVGASGEFLPFTFGGKYGYYRDVFNGLIYVRRRVYDPNTFQWLSVDPLGVRVGDDNSYAYVANCPLVYVDPLGLMVRHHWFMKYWSTGDGQTKVNGKCVKPHIDIDDYATEYTTAESRWLHGRHGGPEISINYQAMYEAILKNTKTCCEFLISMHAMMLAWNALVCHAQSIGAITINAGPLKMPDPEFNGTRPFDLINYYNRKSPPTSNYQDFIDKIILACGCLEDQKLKVNDAIDMKMQEIIKQVSDLEGWNRTSVQRLIQLVRSIPIGRAPAPIGGSTICPCPVPAR